MTQSIEFKLRVSAQARDWLDSRKGYTRVYVQTQHYLTPVLRRSSRAPIAPLFHNNYKDNRPAYMLEPTPFRKGRGYELSYLTRWAPVGLDRVCEVRVVVNTDQLEQCLQLAEECNIELQRAGKAMLSNLLSTMLEAIARGWLIPNVVNDSGIAQDSTGSAEA